jgi:hypothetical protein
MDPDLLLDDLPAEARALIEEADKEIITVRAEAERQVDEIRARADRAVADVQAHAEEAVRARQRQLLQVLRPLQDRNAREGKLDAALAIRDRIRGLKASLLHAQQDPGSLSGLGDPPVGSSQLFEVTGDTDGTVWGTDVYTSDSDLSTVAVHAGVLQSGERGVVRVTFVDTLNVAFTGSHRNGVWTESFGHWPVGFRIARA